jgi:hypothetical protein
MSVTSRKILSRLQAQCIKLIQHVDILGPSANLMLIELDVVISIVQSPLRPFSNAHRLGSNKFCIYEGYQGSESSLVRQLYALCSTAQVFREFEITNNQGFSIDSVLFVVKQNRDQSISRPNTRKGELLVHLTLNVNPSQSPFQQSD